VKVEGTTATAVYPIYGELKNVNEGGTPDGMKMYDGGE